jgi:hypothetical protein
MAEGLDFEGWDETEFEQFCFQLLDGLADFYNVDWRQGHTEAGESI